MARTYRYTLLRRIGNALIEPLAKLGVGPGGIHLLTVAGRKSGKSYTTPVNLVERSGVQYLVAPYGEVAWVKNARAAGEVRLRRGRESSARQIEELSSPDAAPVLAEYWRRNAITRPFFDVAPDEGAEAFVREAARHPVFRLS